MSGSRQPPVRKGRNEPQPGIHRQQTPWDGECCEDFPAFRASGSDSVWRDCTPPHHFPFRRSSTLEQCGTRPGAAAAVPLTPTGASRHGTTRRSAACTDAQATAAAAAALEAVAAAAVQLSFRILDPWNPGRGSGSSSASEWTAFGTITLRTTKTGEPAAEWASFDDEPFSAALLEAQQHQQHRLEQEEVFPALSLKVESEQGRPPVLSTMPLSLLLQQQQHQQEQQPHEPHAEVSPCADSASSPFSLQIHLGSLLLHPIGVTLLHAAAATEIVKRQQQKSQESTRYYVSCHASKPALLLATPPKDPQAAVLLPAAATPQQAPASPHGPQQHEQNQQQEQQQQQPSLLQRYWWVLPVIVLLQFVTGGFSVEEERPRPAAAAAPHAGGSTGVSRHQGRLSALGASQQAVRGIVVAGLRGVDSSLSAETLGPAATEVQCTESPLLQESSGRLRKQADRNRERGGKRGLCIEIRAKTHRGRARETVRLTGRKRHIQRPKETQTDTWREGRRGRIGAERYMLAKPSRQLAGPARDSSALFFTPSYANGPWLCHEMQPTKRCRPKAAPIPDLTETERKTPLHARSAPKTARPPAVKARGRLALKEGGKSLPQVRAEQGRLCTAPGTFQYTACICWKISYLVELAVDVQSASMAALRLSGSPCEDIYVSVSGTGSPEKLPLSDYRETDSRAATTNEGRTGRISASQACKYCPVWQKPPGFRSLLPVTLDPE
ncbi:uncharacterized protein LOC34620188 [Cyclospora cayetanensis]|uniref:Uncharacterized protein LOC34620188 n=1 Tax=Cyclospora cayetanensis TaxID=88456 RepID=A0A6P6RWS0_9EIME|nr:uncharacterized protein LOC34620188 [Cyclospora cayetanensis]